APGVFREMRMVERLGALDLGDVVPSAYCDYLRPSRRARNEPEVVAYSAAVGERVAWAAENGRFVLGPGGGCSGVLGGLPGARRGAGGAIGLAYIDAHADFATPEQSRTGSVAGMALGLAVGRGESSLARLGGVMPLVDAGAVALIGRRDHAELAAAGIL